MVDLLFEVSSSLTIEAIFHDYPPISDLSLEGPAIAAQLGGKLSFNLASFQRRHANAAPGSFGITKCS